MPICIATIHPHDFYQFGIFFRIFFRFYPRWKEYEMLQAAVLNYTLAETQWEIDWTTLLSLANQPGSSLEQIHIFALSHIMRRVSVDVDVKSWNCNLFINQFLHLDLFSLSQNIADHRVWCEIREKLPRRRYWICSIRRPVFATVVGTKFLHKITDCAWLHTWTLQRISANRAI